MTHSDILFIILYIITIIIGLWLVIALIPPTITNIEQIRKYVRMAMLSNRINHIHKLQQTEEYSEKDDKTRANIDKTLFNIESAIDSMERAPLSQEDIELSLLIQKSIASIIDSNVDAFVHNNYAITGDRYDVLRVDTDVKNISSYVFSSLNPDIFKLNLLYTENYLMTYIVEYTKTKLLSVVIQYNANNF